MQSAITVGSGAGPRGSNLLRRQNSVFDASRAMSNVTEPHSDTDDETRRGHTIAVLSTSRTARRHRPQRPQEPEPKRDGDFALAPKPPPPRTPPHDGPSIPLLPTPPLSAQKATAQPHPTPHVQPHPTPPLSTQKPAAQPHPTPHVQPHVPRPIPLRHLDPPLATLSRLRPIDAFGPPIIMRASDADVAAWEDRHGVHSRSRIESRDPLPYEYNSRTGEFIVKCTPSPYHGAISLYFHDAAHEALVSILPAPAAAAGAQRQARAPPRKMDPARAYTTLGLRLCTGSQLTGFTGIAALASRSRKVPDFALMMGAHATFPGLAVEVGFSETFAALVQDAGLLLLGTAGATRVVIVVKLYERPRVDFTKRAWPPEVQPPAASGAGGMSVDEKRAELEEHVLGQVERAPLVGKMSGEVAVYTRVADGAAVCAGLAIRGARVQPEEPKCAGITCVYRYTFMDDDEPVDYFATDDGDDGDESQGTTVQENDVEGEQTHVDADTNPNTNVDAHNAPWILTFPLHLLLPARPPTAPLNATLQSHMASPITFDLLSLADRLSTCKPHMEVWRAKYAAEAMLSRWKKAQRGLPANPGPPTDAAQVQASPGRPTPAAVLTELVVAGGNIAEDDTSNDDSARATRGSRKRVVSVGAGGGDNEENMGWAKWKRARMAEVSRDDEKDRVHADDGVGCGSEEEHEDTGSDDEWLPSQQIV